MTLSRVRARVANSQQVLVLEAVVVLDRGLTKILAHLDLLRVSPDPEAIDSLVKLIPMVASAMREVRERLLGGSDEAAIQGVERTLQARATVVLVQLDELRAAESEIDPASLQNAGRLRSVRELSRYLTDRLGRVNANLLRERRELNANAADGRHHAALYRIALGNAEYGYAAIGKDLDVNAFLRVGAAHESKRFRLSCRKIARALDIANHLAPSLGVPRNAAVVLGVELCSDGEAARHTQSCSLARRSCR